jgi:hypothetical protein
MEANAQVLGGHGGEKVV